MNDTRVWSFRTTARTPWGFMSHAATTLDEIDPISVEEAQRTNLRTVQERLTPDVTFPGFQIRTPNADTTIHVIETLVGQDLMSEDDEGDHLEQFAEYEIEYWRMSA